MSWLTWGGIGGLVVMVLGFVFRKKGWPMFNRRAKTIEKDIKELDEQKEVEDAGIEERRDAYHKRNPFE